MGNQLARWREFTEVFEERREAFGKVREAFESIGKFSGI